MKKNNSIEEIDVKEETKAEKIKKFLKKYNGKLKNSKRINEQEAKNKAIGKIEYKEK